MEPEGSMPRLQGLSNNPRINPIPRIDTYLFEVHSNISSHLRLGLPKGLFPVGLPVNILKALLLSSILATCPAHLNLLDLITLPLVIVVIKKGIRSSYSETIYRHTKNSKGEPLA